MPCLDTDLYRNTHAHTRNRGIRTLLHTCMHRYARSSSHVHTRVTHSVTYMHTYTNARTLVSPRTHAHSCSANTERQVCTSMGGRCYSWSPAIKYGFTWSKHKKIEVTNSRGSHLVIVCKLRQNVPLKSFRTGPRGVKVWHNVMSLSFSLALLYTDMYNIHGGSC